MILDASLLAELGELDDSGEGLLLRGLVDDYEKNRKKLVAEIREGVKTGDLKRVEFAAHSLRSSSGGLGAPTAQKACERMESYGREKWVLSNDEVEQMLKQVESETHSAWTALVDYMKRTYPSSSVAA